MSKRRVVVTGLGAVTPVGNNVQAFWESVKTGKVGIGEITRFDTADFKAVSYTHLTLPTNREV